MDDYVAEICKLENKFSGLEIHHIIQDNNVAADVLSKLGSDRSEVPPGIFLHELHHPSVTTSDHRSEVPPGIFLHELHHLSVTTFDQMNIDSGPSEPSREVMMMEVD